MTIAAEINTNYLGLAGPGVKHLGLDGQAPSTGPNSAGPNSGQVVVPNSGTTGTWVDETDIRPTLMYLTGLKDDYEHDGRVISEVLADPNRALSAPAVTSLGACYKQLNSSVGQFGNFTLKASTAAVESSSVGDGEYKTINAALTGLDRLRDALALRIKGELEAAAFGDQPVFGAQAQTTACQAIIASAGVLAKHLCRFLRAAPPSDVSVRAAARPSHRVSDNGPVESQVPAVRPDPKTPRDRHSRLDRLDRHSGARHRPAQSRPVPGGGAGRRRRPARRPGQPGRRVRGGGGGRSQPGRRTRGAGRAPLCFVPNGLGSRLREPRRPHNPPSTRWPGRGQRGGRVAVRRGAQRRDRGGRAARHAGGAGSRPGAGPGQQGIADHRRPAGDQPGQARADRAGRLRTLHDRAVPAGRARFRGAPPGADRERRPVPRLEP